MKKGNNTISSIFKGNKAIQVIKKGLITVYEAFRELIASGVPPLTLLNCKGVDLVDYKIYGNSIQDGTPTPETPVEIESVGDYDETTGKYKIPVKARGKNIFDYNYYFENIEATTEAIGGTKFQLKPNTTYTVSTNIEFNKYANAFVKTTNTMPSTTQNGIYDTHPLTIKTGSNGVLYIMTRTAKTASYEVVVTLDDFKNGIYWIQLEENRIQTDYEPYVGLTTNIYLNEPLRKTGDYADYIDFKTRKVVRIVGEKALKGTDGNWSSTVAWGNHAFFISNLKNMLGWGTTVGALCSHLQSYTGKTTTTLSNQWVIGGSNIVLVNDNCLTSAELKTWLNENDVRIIYPLATPIEEPIELPNIPTFKGTTILEIGSAINSSYMEVVYFGNGKLQNLNEEDNVILNNILGSDTETVLNVTNTEINEKLDEIIGG